MGGKGSAKVYDYLLSVDYAVCSGPVDSVNMVWVKDKRIWCGQAKSRLDMDIDLPELFGGDDAEGGVSGVVEVYTGTSDQVASDQLARRHDRYSAIMPGYRGIAHLFFRGRKELEASDAEIKANGGTVTEPLNPLEAFAAKIRNGVTARGPRNLGFKWGTNNPYFPKVKMNITRTPDVLGDGNQQVWPYGDPLVYPDKYDFAASSPDVPVAQDTNLLGFTQNGTTTTIDVRDIAAAGASEFSTSYYVRCVYNGTLGTTANDPAMCIYTFSITQHDANGQALLNPAGDGYKYNWSVQADNIVGALLKGKIHPNAKTLTFKATFTPLDVITSTMQIINNPDYRSITTTYYDVNLHCRVDGQLGALPDANPAHILYECMTNAEWGKGEDPALMDLASFQAASQTLFDENFGLSMQWTRQTEIENFVQEILNHVRGVLFENPMTGLWEFRLLRKVANAEQSPKLDPSNCVVEDGKRTSWGATINEIVVSYTDPQTEKEATVTAHDLGNIQIQGRVNPDTRNYYGIRYAALAQKVADRDVAEAGYPLWSATIHVSRSAELPLPGDVRVLDWPEDGIFGMVVRVLKVNFGKLGSRSVKIEVTEDIFSVDAVRYREPQKSEWGSENAQTQRLSAAVAMGLPAPFYVMNGYDIATIDTSYPEVGIGLFATADDYELYDVNVLSETTDRAGVTATRSIATIAPSVSIDIDTGTDGEVVFAREFETVIPETIIDTAAGGDPSTGDLFFVGTSEADHEIVMLSALDTDGWHLARGVYDTLPREWVSPVRLWRLEYDAQHVDPVKRSVGEAVQYDLVPRGPSGSLDASFATSVSHTATDRPFAPFRPSNTLIGGASFEGFKSNGFPAGGLTASWSIRNRTIEDALVSKWTDGSSAAETGQTTTLVVYDEAEVEQNRISGIDVDTMTLAVADLAGVEAGFIEFLSERDGYTSLMAAKIPFKVRVTGYGNNYGRDYGYKTGGV